MLIIKVIIRNIWTDYPQPPQLAKRFFSLFPALTELRVVLHAFNSELRPDRIGYRIGNGSPREICKSPNVGGHIGAFDLDCMGHDFIMS